MRFLRLCAGGAVLPILFAFPISSSLPSCSQTSPQPCQCPEGTDYQTVTTYMTYGASAFDVRNLTGDFYDLSWIPQTIKERHGRDNEIGSTRTTVVGTDVGLYEWVEELTKLELQDDGSFVWAIKIDNVPLPFKPGPGLFAGEWISFKAEHLGKHQTKVSWNLYGCHTGGTHGYVDFQRGVMGRIESLLAKAGKIKGESNTPVTVVGKPWDMTLDPAGSEGGAAAAAAVGGADRAGQAVLAEKPAAAGGVYWPAAWTAY